MLGLHENDLQLTKYEKCLRKLYFVENVKRGLLNMELLYDALGKPMDNPNIKVIHIAGTNGKGSVALKVAIALQSAGHDVGIVTSPHISSFRERIQINGRLISEDEVGEYLSQILRICDEQSIPATFFEITTALAFLYFSKKHTNVVVLETGLGGRLDATNVIKRPCLCIITSIGLEHTALLGDTVEKIAAEKAGIIKQDVPILVTANVPHDVIQQCAKEKGAEGYYTCNSVLKDEKDIPSTSRNRVECFDYDKENSRTAMAALKLLDMKSKETNGSSFIFFPITDDHIKQGISKRPICRFEERRYHASSLSEKKVAVNVILDIAHNPPAMRVLFRKLEATYPKQKKRLVIGFSAEKDLIKCAQIILSSVPDPSSIHLTEASNLRAAKLEAIFQAEPALKQSNYNTENRSVAVQVTSALQLALERNEVLVVCGSVFLMSEAREVLGIKEPRDSKQITNVAGSGLQKCKEKQLLLK